MNRTQSAHKASAWHRGLITAAALLAATAGLSAGVTTAGSAADAAPIDTTRVLVIGGTGQLGAEIVRRLVARGHQVTVFVRPSSDRSRLAAWPVEYVTGDLFSEADMAAALTARQYGAVVVALRVMDGDVNFYSKALTPLARHARKGGVGAKTCCAAAACPTRSSATAASIPPTIRPRVAPNSPKTTASSRR